MVVIELRLAVDLLVVLAGGDNEADALGDVGLHAQSVFQRVDTTVPGLAFRSLEETAIT